MSAARFSISVGIFQTRALTAVQPTTVTMSCNLSTTNVQNGPKRRVCMENINPNVKIMEYAVRGPLVIRATQIEKELERVTILTLRCTLR